MVRQVGGDIVVEGEPRWPRGLPFASSWSARYLGEMKGPDRVRTLAERLRGGGLVLVLDDALDPPEAVLACAAARVTPAAVNFMATHARGLVCLGLTRERMRRLGIPLMATDADRAGAGVRRLDRGAARRVHRDQRRGSRHDDPGGVAHRAATPADLVMPGHVTPIQLTPGGSAGAGRAPRGGERSRCGWRACGLAAVLCEVLGSDGNLASAAELDALAPQASSPAS